MNSKVDYRKVVCYNKNKNMEGNGNMDMSPSKQKILDEALKLFAKNGYEATSIEQITSAVGIKKASFYSHFKSKQEVLDWLINEIEERYKVYSQSLQKDWEAAREECKEAVRCTEEDIFNAIKRQFGFLAKDPFFCMARNFLTIEQFRNPQLASLQNKCEYVDALNYHRKIIQYLVENGVLIDRDIEIMTYEFFSPIYVQFYQFLKEPECKQEAIRIVKKHIHHFFATYSK